MSDTAAHEAGLIGPNAILQLLPVIDQLGGQGRRDALLEHAGVVQVPDGCSMIPETEAARLHRQLRLEEPEQAPRLLGIAGRETGRYILANRIPSSAQTLLKALPRRLSARLLSRAIARHAWTFVGSGALRLPKAGVFEIENNPLIRGERGRTCLCHWHLGVFDQLFQTLVSPSCTFAETRCGAQPGSHTCRFALDWRR